MIPDDYRSARDVYTGTKWAAADPLTIPSLIEQLRGQESTAHGPHPQRFSARVPVPGTSG